MAIMTRMSVQDRAAMHAGLSKDHGNHLKGACDDILARMSLSRQGLPGWPQQWRSTKSTQRPETAEGPTVPRSRSETQGPGATLKMGIAACSMLANAQVRLWALERARVATSYGVQSHVLDPAWER